MTTAYERAITLAKAPDGTRTGAIDESWWTGRGAFGGLVASMILQAMTEDLADAERVVRSITVHFCAPANGNVVLSTENVRAGNKVTHYAARLVSEGKVASFASASFGKERANAWSYQQATMPSVDPASSIAPLPIIAGAPAFIQHFDIRYAGPTYPWSSAKEARIAAWIRLREPQLIDAPVVAMLLDVLPPAVCAMFDKPRPGASVDFTMQYFAHEPFELDANAHHLVAINSRWSGDGYAEEMRDLWSPEGKLIAQCRQVMALL